MGVQNIVENPVDNQVIWFLLEFIANGNFKLINLENQLPNKLFSKNTKNRIRNSKRLIIII